MTNAKQLGRPVNENSVRQIKLKEIAEKRAQGLIKRGRPTNENSKNAAKTKARQEKLAAGIVLKRGRPVNETSARQQRLNDLSERRSNGTLKLGRPKQQVIVEVKSKTKKVDLTPTIETNIEQTPEVAQLVATVEEVTPVKLQGNVLIHTDKVKLLKNGKIIAMSVDRKFAEKKCAENPNLSIL